ncbi:carboxypeptidase-like regulatory domain-containing protein [Adhaeribacter aquaticus]|uniref:carboxypeptidase-like regulatory domain-containing protein n=1 Tax=Adhaeribacter aquaticus TaxID=299567 RepID=UPI00041CEE45|nr:carboxypeptidase-like regulatory domain-containing protein [Adhaeribacter aquaticus]
MMALFSSYKNRLIQRLALIILTVAFTPNFLYGQTVISGEILNKNTREPVSYANLGIRNSNVGTISNENGSFSIAIPSGLTNDTLVFSAIGYERKQFPVGNFRSEKAFTIYLEEKINLLSTVIITPGKEKKKVFELGNKAILGGNLETDTTYAGRAISLLIENKGINFQGLLFPAYLEKARLYILRNNLKSFKFRVRVNEVDGLTGQPGNDLLQKSIVVQSSIKKGWLEFDLSELNLQVTKPFFITFEQIIDLQDRVGIADGYREYMHKHPKEILTDTIEFEGKKQLRQTITKKGINLPGTFIAYSNSAFGLKNYVTFLRETSFSQWQKMPFIVTATVFLSN